MWFLECDGELFQNKRVWLRPGSKHLFGRTNAHSDPEHPEQRSYAIDNKSVSRKHLIIDVGPVAPGDGGKLSAKSEVTVTDNSRVGTHLDGEKLLGSSKVLTKVEHAIKLGNYVKLFRITWKPVVLTLASSDKQGKGEDPLARTRSRLESLDIKTLLPYAIGSTTHVVANKRNTAKGLQALVNAKYIVTEAFVDAITAAAAFQHNAEDPEAPIPSALEQDFDQNWPDATKYLPDPGREPVPRPAEMFAPNPNRGEVFSGYTFVFCDSTQFENLEAPITNGGGKARYFELVEGVTTVEEFVQFVKSLAGENGVGEFEDGSEGKGVVVVRFRIKKITEEWALRFGRAVELALGQRSIEQNEFLDAILMNDAKSLRRPLEEEVVVESSFPAPNREPSPVAETSAAIRQESAKAAPPAVEEKLSEAPTARRRVRRAITQSRFKGFDDFDPSQLPKIPSSLPEASQPAPDSVIAEDSQEVLVESSQPTRPSRKRQIQLPELSENEENAVDSLLPAAAAMKRRRLADLDKANDASIPEPENGASKRKAEESKNAEGRSGKKKEPEIDILSAARSRREAADEAARQDAESLRNALEGMDIEAIRNLVQVEEMEVAPRADKGGGEVRSDRWDERWNGRKNFKRFRRKGEGEAAVRRPKVIVGLEEAKKKDYGIGEDYWLERDDGRERRSSREAGRDTQQSQRQRRSQTGENTQSNAQADRPTRGQAASARDTAATHPEQDDQGPEERSDRQLRNRRVDVRRAAEPTQSSTLPMSDKARGKRPAVAAVPARAPPAKRTRRMASKEDTDESDDEAKFRFRSKRR